jgi:hypothetical protein
LIGGDAEKGGGLQDIHLHPRAVHR